jgi:stearoyl-CoA desaturase (delta-9 desaturase)
MAMLSIHFMLFFYAMFMHWSWSFLLIAWLLGKLIGYLGNEIGMHRLWSHKSFQTVRWKECLLHLCAVPLLAGSSIAYAGIHRQHHAFSDTEKDPHQTNSALKTLFYFRNKDVNISPKLVSDLIKCPLHKWLHVNYFKINFVFLIVCLLILGPVYTGWFVSSVITYNFIVIGLVNIYGHRPAYGKRNFDTNDRSTNNFWLQALTWNHGLHNNHHKYPASYRMNVNPKEFDFPGWIIEKFFKRA